MTTSTEVCGSKVARAHRRRSVASRRRTRNPFRGFIELPSRVRGELWPWIIAVGAYEHGDRYPLDVLCVDAAFGNRVVPEELRPLVRDVMHGKRPPGRRTPGVPPRERMRLGATVALMRELMGLIATSAPCQDLPPGLENLAEHAYRTSGEVTTPSELRRELEDRYRLVVRQAATEFGCSDETIENCVREYRRLVNQLAPPV